MLSLSVTVKKTRLGLINEVTRGLTFSEQFISSFKATLDFLLETFYSLPVKVTGNSLIIHEFAY